MLAAPEALKGHDALQMMGNITSHAPHIYQSQILTQSYNLDHSDQIVAASGSRSMSFKFVGDSLHARIERSYKYNVYSLLDLGFL